MDDEQLIECVRNYEFIYNLQHPKYMDNIKKEVAWKQIADEMKQSAVACKQKWQCLRDSYRRALNKKKETSRQAGRKMKKWKYEDELSFLAPFLSQRKILDSVELTSDDDDPNETCAENPRSRTDELAVIGNAKDAVNTENAVRANATPKRTVKRLKTPQLASAILMAKLLDQQNTFSPQKERDELDNFFLNISATVKKFPPYQQALAKNKIFSVVSKMELQHFAPPSTLQYEFSPSPSVSSIAPSAVESPDNWNEFEHQQYTNME